MGECANTRLEAVGRQLEGQLEAIENRIGIDVEHDVMEDEKTHRDSNGR
jgi:hypothetical protein